MEIYKKRKEVMKWAKAKNLFIFGLDSELVGNCIMKAIDYKNHKINKIRITK